MPIEPYTVDTPIEEVTADPAFGDYGRLIFPVDGGYYSGDTLGDLDLVWYNYIDPDKTVEICNYMRAHAQAGESVFYDIYTEEEKAADPDKEDTGLFFFKGRPGAKFAVCNAGGWRRIWVPTARRKRPNPRRAPRPGRKASRRPPAIS